MMTLLFWRRVEISMDKKYQKTLVACFIGFIVQAITNNFIPLLFVTFQNAYGIPLRQITVLISANFLVQLIVDVIAVQFVDKTGYRIPVLFAHGSAACGLALLTILPEQLDPFTGILVSVIIYSVGAGLIEVTVSPIMEGCPTAHKGAAMSLLHSFYCWGHVGVVLLSTLFFYTVGIENWKILTWVWVLVPAVNILLFARTPIQPLLADGEDRMTLKELLSVQSFWPLMLMMVCAGASEHALGQWTSAFAEQALGISKTLGDLMGPLAFAAFMGCARTIYGKYGARLDLEKFVKGSCILCTASYLLTGLAEHPLFSLAGCALCGLSVGILWPGTYSRAAHRLKGGGGAMFAVLAVFGDLGCVAGPAVVGVVTDLSGGNMKTGIWAAAIFPLFLLGCFGKRKRKKCDV